MSCRQAPAEKAPAMLDTVNSAIPVFSIFFLPLASAIFPIGTLIDEQANIYIVTTHPTAAAPVLNSFPMFGIDKLSELDMNVVKNAVVTATISVIFCSLLNMIVFLPKP